jgi:hypothetical protein
MEFFNPKDSLFGGGGNICLAELIEIIAFQRNSLAF